MLHHRGITRSKVQLGWFEQRMEGLDNAITRADVKMSSSMVAARARFKPATPDLCQGYGGIARCGTRLFDVYSGEKNTRPINRAGRLPFWG